MPRHPRGPRTGRCCHTFLSLPALSPSSPALFLTCSPGIYSEAESQALASGFLPLARGPPRPSRIPTGWAHLFAYFYLCSCWRPIRARSKAGVLGGARAPAAAAPGSRARRIRCWRTAQCYRSPGPPTGVCTAALPRPDSGGRDKGALWEGPPEPHLPAVAGELQAPRWFAGALRVPRTASAYSTCSTPWVSRARYCPSGGFAPALVLLGFPFWPAILPHFSPRPLLVFPRFARPGPRHQSLPATGSRSLSQSLLFSLWSRRLSGSLAWSLPHCSTPPPHPSPCFPVIRPDLPPFLFYNSLLASKPIWDRFRGGRTASGLRTVLQK